MVSTMLHLPRQAPSTPPLTPEEIAYTNAPQILAITGTFFALAALVVLLRCFVRIKMLKMFGVDDYVMVLAMICATSTFVGTNLRVKYGLGKYYMVLFMDPDNVRNFFHVQYVQSIFWLIAVSSIKISIAFTLLRLSTYQTYRRFIWACIIFLILITLACGGTIVWQCTNPVSAIWDYSKRPPPLGTGHATCFSDAVFTQLGLMNSILNIITDVVFATLPVPLIWRLHLNRRTKISLIVILSLGYLATAAGIVKTWHQTRFFQEPNWTVKDSFNTWGYLEITIGIIAASLPTLKPLFKELLESAKAISSGGRSRGGTSKGGYTKTEDGWSQAIDLDSLSEDIVRVAHSSSDRPTGIAEWEAQRTSDEKLLRPKQILSSDRITRTTNITVV